MENEAKNKYKEYQKNNFKRQTVKFKIEEMESIEAYCELWGEAKNSVIRKAVMDYIGKPIE